MIGEAEARRFWNAGAMEIGALIFAAIVTFAAGASAVFAFVQAKAATDTLADAREAQSGAALAQKNAEAARDEANKIAKAAAAQLSRSAAALERANELTEAAMPKPSVTWAVSRIRGDLWRCLNSGDLAASNVKLSGAAGIHTDADSEADVVPPGQALEFGAMQVEGFTPMLTVEWDDENAPARRSETVAIRGY